MRKIASISILAILLFNWCGYRFVVNWMQQKADSQLEARLDRHDYEESDLMLIRVPLNLPYQTNWAAFERYDGEVEVGGIHYKYVARKIEDGQLLLKCIPNPGRQQLQNAKDQFFSLVNDLQANNASKKSNAPTSNIVKISLGDFDDQVWAGFAAHRRIHLPQYNLFLSAPICEGLLTGPAQPPEA